MKIKLLPQFAFLLIFFSCKDVAEVSPNIRISGVYESTIRSFMVGSRDQV